MLIGTVESGLTRSGIGKGLYLWGVYYELAMVEENESGFIATDVDVRYVADAGRYIFEFENPDGEQVVSFPPYRMAAMLEQVFEEGKWGAVPDLEAMSDETVNETPSGLDEE